MGLSAILDVSKGGDRILAVSFGSGAGSDAFHIEVTDEIGKLHDRKVITVRDMLKDVKFLDYAIYAKFKRKIVFGEEIE